VDSGVPQGVTYTYTVSAVDAAGNVGAASAMRSVSVPDTTRPNTPTAPSVTLGAAAGVTVANVSWTASTDNVGVKNYVVRRDGLVLATPSSTSYQDQTVVPGKTYAYTVTAMDAAGNASTTSTATAVTIADTTPPSIPGRLTATAGAKKIVLAWTASSDNIGVTGYEVWRGTKLLNKTSATTYSNGGLITGNSYSYTVRAYDAKGNFSAFTAAVVATSK
jgi:chitodextrinase